MGRTIPVAPDIKAYIKHKPYSNVNRMIKETGVSRTQIYRIWQEKTVKRSNVKSGKKRRISPGRPTKLSKRAQGRLIRLVKTLRNQDPNWTVRPLMSRAGVEDLSPRTVSKFLNKHGYHYLQAHKKGLLSEKDKIKIIKFANRVLREFDENFWTQLVAFYLDGVGFVYKRNPKDQALAPTGRVWRKRKEDVAQGCTAKGSASGTGGKYVKLVFTISHDKGIVMHKRYEKMDGAYFVDFLTRTFNTMVDRAAKGTRVWVQDGDPSQNSKMARNTMERINSDLFGIPPRSPDMNPIEKNFRIGEKKMHEDGIKHDISVESMSEFHDRIIRTMNAIPIPVIKKTIESIDIRMQKIIECKGERLKY
eukprot:gene12555-biopygen10007